VLGRGLERGAIGDLAANVHRLAGARAARQHAHVGAARDQLRHQLAADEAGAADYEDAVAGTHGASICSRVGCAAITRTQLRTTASPSASDAGGVSPALSAA